MEDLISRQAVLDALNNIEIPRNASWYQYYQQALTAVDKLPPALSTNLAEVGTDCISREQAIDECYPITVDGEVYEVVQIETLMGLPSVQPERTCVNCGRTINNGGWYADGRTRCPIEEHYALPKDGYCHLWEKRNVTDDDYPERREE